MVDVTYGGLPAADPVTGTDVLGIEQSAGTRGATADQVKTFVLARHNYTANAAPTATDDSGAGYEVGSVWHDNSTSPVNVYFCADATASAAVWVGPVVSDGDLGSAAYSATTDFATAAQGTTADDAEIMIWQGI